MHAEHKLAISVEVSHCTFAFHGFPHARTEAALALYLYAYKAGRSLLGLQRHPVWKPSPCSSCRLQPEAATEQEQELRLCLASYIKT